VSASLRLGRVRFAPAMAVFVSHTALPSIRGPALARLMPIKLADSALTAFFALAAVAIPTPQGRARKTSPTTPAHGWHGSGRSRSPRWG